MASNSVINTDLVGSIVHGLKFISRLMPQNIFYVDFRKKEPSQTSKTKLPTKVVNTSRDIFRTLFIIQNVFRTSRMVLFAKIMNE